MSTKQSDLTSNDEDDGDPEALHAADSSAIDEDEDGPTANNEVTNARKPKNSQATTGDSENESSNGTGSVVTSTKRYLTSWKWYCFVSLYFVQLIGSPFFLYWLLTGAWNFESPVASALFLCAEVIAYISSSLFLFTGLFSRKKKSGKPKRLSLLEKKAHVAVCICRYKEPLEDLFVSIGCMLDIDWPADKIHLFILDDGFYYQCKGDQEKQMIKLSQIILGANSLCTEDPLSLFEVQRAEDLHRDDCAMESHSWNIRSANWAESRCEVTLIARKKPEISHYKAGNVNNFLYNHLGQLALVGDPVMEYMLLLDHDMMVAPDVINEALPKFKSEDLAFVQYPQRFFDIVTNDRFYAGNEIFFDGVCENRSHVGLAPFAGTNAIWRCSSLYDVGGFQYGSITEDANTGFAAHCHGYTSEYIARELCVGQSPQNLPDAMRQRMRWSQGSIEMTSQVFKSFFCRQNKPFPCPQVLTSEHNQATPVHRSLSLRQRILLCIVYTDSLIYPFYSFGFILHVGVCVTYLTNAQAPMAPTNPANILLFWLPLHVVKVFCQVFAFPLVSLNVQLNAQKAWAGYALSTIWSIKSAFFDVTSGWFNTGSGNTDRFLLQYGNTFLFVLVLVFMIYRIAAFTVLEGTCEAWMSFGSLVYGVMMTWLLKMWALEPFISPPKETSETLVEDNNRSNRLGSSQFGRLDFLDEPFFGDDGGAFQDDEGVAQDEPSRLDSSDGDAAQDGDDVTQDGSRRARTLIKNHSKVFGRLDSFEFAMRDAVSTKAFRRASRQRPEISSTSRRRLSAEIFAVSQSETQAGAQLKSKMSQQRIRELIGKREAYERHYPNLSILFNFVAVIMVSLTLLVWATGNCDSNGNEQEVVVNIVDDKPKYKPHPPLPAGITPDADFIAVGGGLSLNGQSFNLKGANWFGFETTRKVPFGVDIVSQDSVLETMSKNGINAIRLPLLVEGILDPNNHNFPSWAADTMLNPHLGSLDNYLDGVEAFVHRTSQWGIFTLLDMHLLRADTHPDPLPFDDKTTFEDVTQAWELLSDRLCSHWGVMGADLKNEPYESTWGDNNPSTDWKLLAEKLGTAVSAKCAKWLIFIEGIWRYDDETNPMSNDLLPPWGSMLIPATTNPISIGDESKLVYSPHVYGPGTIGLTNKAIWAPKKYCNELCLMCYCRQPVQGLSCSTAKETKLYAGVESSSLGLGSVPDSCANILPFESNLFPQNIPAYYDLLFGSLVDQNKTVIVGEWGGTYINEVSKRNSLIASDDWAAVRKSEAIWNEEFVDYLVSRSIGSFYWSINPESDDTGGLLLSDWIEEDMAKMALIKSLPSTPTLPLLFPKTVDMILRKCLRNIETVYRASGARYTVESNGYNKDYDGSKQPVAIIFVASEDQVAQSVRCANESNYKVCVRSGGHSYTGDSLCDGVLIDLHHMKKITQLDDTHVFEVESGNTMGDIATTLSRHSRMAPAGNHNGVGSGWMLGCGRGLLSRSFGLGCDYIVSARVVVGTGEIIEATDSNGHYELLWGLRGAGSGHFGIVVSYSIETMPLIPDEEVFSSFKLSYPRDMASAVYSFWQGWAIEHPNSNFTCSYVLWNPAREEVYLEGVLMGTLEQLDKILDEPVAKLGTPQHDEREPNNYLQFLAHAYGSFDVLQFRNPHSGWSGQRRSFHNKAHLLNHSDLNAEGIETLVRHASEVVPGSSAYSNYIEITPLGGVIKNPPRPSAFSHRSAVAVAQYGGYWEKSEAKSPMVSHQRRFRCAMEQYWGNHAYYNYKDNDLLNWEEAYFGKSSVSKLRKVKCRYDPENLFSVMRQSIRCGVTSEQELME